ncbi:MAG: ABC transporter permease [Planctomycetes bacterium]|nr:ABC transporter permease [Planctomycetota bacterium]
MITAVGSKTVSSLDAIGRTTAFAWQMLRWLIPGLVQWRTWVRAMPLLYEVGNRTLPVIIITGTFVGLVLAIQSYDQLAAAGLKERMGVLLTLTLVRELGPVLAGVMVAGRVGGALTAQLGTMRVTEQIAALTVMGADPIRHLVVPRFLACLLLTPLLTFFCDMFGSLAGWFVAVKLKHIPSGPYWWYIEDAILTWDVGVGFAKSVLFGGIIGIIACYKGFHCRAGAEGVGRACTESFVTIFILILATDFFVGTLFSGLYLAIYGFKPLI